MQNTLVNIPVVLGAIDLDLQGQIWRKKSNFQVLSYWKYITTTKPPGSHEYLDCFMGLTVSRSPSSACAHIPRLFHGPDCFTDSTCCTYIDLGTEGVSALTSLLSVPARHWKYSATSCSIPAITYVWRGCWALFWLITVRFQYSQAKYTSIMCVHCSKFLGEQWWFFYAVYLGSIS